MCNSEQQNFEQYIVVPQGAASGKGQQQTDLSEFLDCVQERPDVSVVNVVGEVGNPQRLLIRATAETVDNLQANFQNELIFEKDQPLELF